MAIFINTKKYAGFLALVSFYCHPAVASDDYLDLSLKELSAITVSSPFPESYLTATSSVSIIDADSWQKLGSRRIADVLATLPSTMTYSSVGTHAIAFRGFAHTTSSARGIATLLDGVPLNGFGSGSALYNKLQFNLDSLSQVQVLRGPSSALYGSDAFHGVIALQSFQSDSDLQTARAQFGSDRYWQTTWNSSAGVGAGWRLDSSIGLSEKPDESRRYEFTDPVTSQQATGEFAYRNNAQTLMAKLRSPANSSVGTYSVGAYSNRYIADDHPGGGQASSPGVSRAGSKDHVDSETYFDMVKADAQWQLADDSELMLKTYFWRAGLDSIFDLTELATSPTNRLTRTNDSRSGLELRLKQQLPADTNFLLSASYDRQHINDRLSRSFDTAGNKLSEIIEGSDNSNLYTGAVVSQFKTHLFNDSLILVYGGRYDSFSTVEGKFTPRAGTIFRLDPQQSVKLLYGRAFRAPTAIELYGVTNTFGNLDLKPETITTWELVYMFQTDYWRTELVGFASNWENGIANTPCTRVGCTSGQTEYKNLNESKSRGAEFIVEALFDRWVLHGSASYTDSSNDTLVSGQYKTSRYSAFPRKLVQLNIGYRFDHDIELTAANTLMHDATEGIGSPSNDFSETRLTTYWRTDIHISKLLQPGTSVALHVTNLFNRENWRPSVFNTENGLEDSGRTVSIAANHSF
jgi:outer membrane receptor for ferrienterochelin and colicin